MTGWVDLRFWKNGLWDEVKKCLAHEEAQGHIIFPPKKQIFRSLTLTPLLKTRVVILGQDPYHTPGAADGLAFSVPEGYRIPPSLANIFKELQSDLNFSENLRGPLDGWARQGILLINSVWTCRAHQAHSHSSIGWQNLTKEILETLSDANFDTIFVLWGNHAQTYANYLPKNSWIIKSPHPSPLSAHNGFFGSRPFSKINQYLTMGGEPPIDWLQVNNFTTD